MKTTIIKSFVALTITTGAMSSNLLAANIQLGLQAGYLNSTLRSNQISDSNGALSTEGAGIGLNIDFTLNERLKTTTTPFLEMTGGTLLYDENGQYVNEQQQTILYQSEYSLEVRQTNIGVAQAISYDLPWNNIIFRPFAQVALGYMQTQRELIGRTLQNQSSMLSNTDLSGLATDAAIGLNVLFRSVGVYAKTGIRSHSPKDQNGESFDYSSNYYGAGLVFRF